MKKYLLLFLIALSFFSELNAQAYYYYNGSKQFLKTSNNKFAVFCFSPSFKLDAESNVKELETKIISGNCIKIYQCDDFISIKMLSERSKTERDWYMMSCYTMNDYDDLTPVGLINVRLKNQDDFSKMEEMANLYHLEVVSRNKFMPLWYVLKVTDKTSTDILEIANNLYEAGLFMSSSPTFDSIKELISYDPNIYQQWGLYNKTYEGVDISISDAWNYATGRGVKIGIVDSGFDIQHIDLNANIYSSYDANGDSVPCNNFPDYGHGTHCAGIAAAVRNNGIHISGVAPDAKLMCTNFSGSSISTFDAAANAINWAWKNGADIISCSWCSSPFDLIKEAIDSALTRGRNNLGCIIVAAAGNDATNIVFPANYNSDIIAVASMEKAGTIWYNSNYGNNMFVAAPGCNILSTIPNNSIEFKTGTSMAAPFVAGVAALILERNPYLTNQQVREIIGTNAKKIGNYPYNQTKEFGTWNEHSGYGMVDAYHSVFATPRYQDMNNP